MRIQLQPNPQSGDINDLCMIQTNVDDRHGADATYLPYIPGEITSCVLSKDGPDVFFTDMLTGCRFSWIDNEKDGITVLHVSHHIDDEQGMEEEIRPKSKGSIISRDSQHELSDSWTTPEDNKLTESEKHDKRNIAQKKNWVMVQ